LNAEPSSMGKSISRAEALLTARRILEKAELERTEFAELEAARGVRRPGEEASFSREEETRTEGSV